MIALLQPLELFLHTVLVPLAAVITVAIGLLARYASQREKDKRPTPAWIIRVERNSWWILGLCALFLLAGTYTPKAKSAAEIAELRTVYNGLMSDCMLGAVRYGFRHSGQRGRDAIIAPRGPIDRWQRAEALPDVKYSEEEWSRLLPIFESDYREFDARLRDVLAEHQSVLPADFRQTVQAARQQMESDRINYYGMRTRALTRPVPDESQSFNAVVRHAATTLGDFCCKLSDYDGRLPEQ